VKLQLVAHRGWSKRFPENSLIAFGAALAAGADEIELDLWCTRDNAPFVCHDSTLDRVSNLRGKHDEFTLAEIKNAEIKMPDGAMLPGVGLPTLEEALDFCAGRIAVNIHIKHAGPDDLILRSLRDYFSGARPACGSYIAGGRDVLTAARKICPEIPRCCLEGQGDGGLLVRNALDLDCERVQFCRDRFSGRDVDRALEAGLVTNLFWSDDAREMAELLKAGISAPLTNDIGFVRPQLKEWGLVD